MSTATEQIPDDEDAITRALPCFQLMKCLCALHARGLADELPCNTDERVTDDEIRALYRRGKKIEALKQLRARDVFTLADAQHALSAMCSADDDAAFKAALAANDAANKAIVATTAKPAWGGYEPPAGTKLAWGGRAIYRLVHTETPQKRRGSKVVQRASSRTEASIDIPYDRHEMIGPTDAPTVEAAPSVAGELARAAAEAERKALGKWIDKVGLPAVRKWCVKAYVTGDSEERFTMQSDGYTITASPKGSHGYLYICAWKVQP